MAESAHAVARVSGKSSIGERHLLIICSRAVWSIYPVSPFANVTQAQFPPLLERNGDSIYPGCEGARMAGLPITTSTTLPMESLFWPVTTKLEYTALAKTQDNDYTTAAPTSSSTSTIVKRTASVHRYHGDSTSNVLTPTTSLVVRDTSGTSTPAPVVPAGFRRRQLTRF